VTAFLAKAVYQRASEWRQQRLMSLTESLETKEK
jgi:hypothetical protein